MDKYSGKGGDVTMGILFLILASVLLNCTAQICMKSGMLAIGELGGAREFVEAIPRMVASPALLGSAFCYLVSIALWPVVLSQEDVSCADPFLSI